MKKMLAGMACLLVTLTVIGGCASKAPKDFNFDKNPNDGIVVFAVSHDASAGRGVTMMAYLDGGSKVLGNAPYSSVDDAVGIKLPSDFDEDYGRIAVVNLPAGKHAFTSWQITNGTGLRILPKKDLPPLEFEVKAGAVSYLGDIHGIALMGRNLFGITITGDGYPEVRDQHARDIAVLEKKYPQFRGKAEIRLLPLGPWLNASAKSGLKTAN